MKNAVDLLESKSEVGKTSYDSVAEKQTWIENCK